MHDTRHAKRLGGKNFQNFSGFLPKFEGVVGASLIWRKTDLANGKTHPQWFLAAYCIGAKLRSLRTEKRLTLARLAAETGLSTALLSKLETDRMLPTLATLATICRVYGVGLGHFFCDPAEHLLSITRNVAGQGRGRSAEEGTRVPLHPGVTGRRMDAAMVHLPKGTHVPAIDSAADRALLVYVIEGQLKMEIGGLRETLDAGDCAYLESGLPANWGSASAEDCRLLTVTAKSVAVAGTSLDAVEAQTASM